MSEEPTEELDDRAGLADHPLTAVRLEKLNEFRSRGLDPYPHTFHRDASAASIHESHPGLEPGAETGEMVTVAGRLLNVRSFGKLRFGVLQDHSGQIQLFVSKAVLGDAAFEIFDLIDNGDWVGAHGEVITTKKGELSIRVDRFDLLAKSLRPLPDKWHGLQDQERRYRQRYLDLTVNEEARATALARIATVRSLRRSFEERGFLEVETPMLQVKPGGALAKPFVTHHKALDLDMYLRIAPELYLKRLIVGGMDKVFEINRNFRNEGIDTTHNPEFTMLESYEAFADYEDVMAMTEQVVAAAANDVTGSSVVMYQGQPVDFTPPFRRLSMLDAVNEQLGLGLAYDTSLDELRRIAGDLQIKVESSWGPGKLIAMLFEATVEDRLWAPTFVIDYPVEVSPLSKRHRTDPDVTERFELIVAGRELANAFTELNDPAEQRRRFELQAAARAAGDDEAHPIDEDYVRALEYGLPPTGGLGIGVDRLVMILTDHASIREVVLFPHLRPE
ncbi:MAG: lysine--tRNA ligase [Acidimicrobiia bacterium]|nr:lysine--tRNA ligase [Acidimicrobiia bacterium]